MNELALGAGDIDWPGDLDTAILGAGQPVFQASGGRVFVDRMLCAVAALLDTAARTCVRPEFAEAREAVGVA